MAAQITPAKRKQILRLQAEGHTNLAIAKRLGMDRHTVGRHAAPTQQRKPAAGTELSIDDQRLRYLLAGLNARGACPECRQIMFWDKRVPSGLCNWCGAEWTLSRPAQARAG